MKNKKCLNCNEINHLKTATGFCSSNCMTEYQNNQRLLNKFSYFLFDNNFNIKNIIEANFIIKKFLKKQANWKN